MKDEAFGYHHHFMQNAENECDTKTYEIFYIYTSNLEFLVQLVPRYLKKKKEL